MAASDGDPMHAQLAKLAAAVERIARLFRLLGARR